MGLRRRRYLRIFPWLAWRTFVFYFFLAWLGGEGFAVSQDKVDLSPVQRKAAVIAKLEKYTGDNNRDGQKVEQLKITGWL